MVNCTELSADWHRNKHSAKSTLIVFMYRASSHFAQHRSLFVRLIGIPVRLIYKLIVEFLMGVELPDRVVAGPGLAVFHGVGLVVNDKARLGRNVTLRQNTTIGAKRAAEPAPIIEDDVSVGVNAVILGAITIGARTTIGAGAVVTRDCPEDSVVYAPRPRVKPALGSEGARDV